MEALEVGVGAARVVAGDVSEGELQLSSKVSHVERHPGQARRPSHPPQPPLKLLSLSSSVSPTSPRSPAWDGTLPSYVNESG